MSQRRQIAHGLILLTAFIAGAFDTAARAAQAAVPPAAPEQGPLEIACDGLPPDAVRNVPAPLDRFVTLTCTRAGQALKPIGGADWLFDIGATWLAAANPKGPSSTDHYRQIAFAPLSKAELAALRQALAAMNPDPAVLQRDILRFELKTSWGKEKQLFLLPSVAKGENVLGFECVNGCHDLKRDGWFFVVRQPAGQN